MKKDFLFAQEEKLDARGQLALLEYTLGCKLSALGAKEKDPLGQLQIIRHF